MSKIVKAHYPVSALPEDLRQGLSPSGEVTVTLEETDHRLVKRSVRELFAARRPPFKSAEEIDQELRNQRDTWDG